MRNKKLRGMSRSNECVCAQMKRVWASLICTQKQTHAHFIENAFHGTANEKKIQTNELNKRLPGFACDWFTVYALNLLFFCLFCSLIIRFSHFIPFHSLAQLVLCNGKNVQMNKINKSNLAHIVNLAVFFWLVANRWSLEWFERLCLILW